MNKIIKARYIEYETALFGACFIAFGLGALVSGYFTSTIMYGIIVLGIVMHGWAMFTINHKNK